MHTIRSPPEPPGEDRDAPPARGDVVHTHDGEPYVYDPAADPHVGDEDD